MATTFAPEVSVPMMAAALGREDDLLVLSAATGRAGALLASPDL